MAKHYKFNACNSDKLKKIGWNNIKWGLSLIHGFVMIKTAIGKAVDVAAEVVKVEGVKSAHAVTGIYDVIATFEVENLAEVADMVVKGIHSIEGVCSTQTAICVTCK